MTVMAAIQVALPVLLRRRWPHTRRRRRRSSPSHNRVIEIQDKIPSSLLDLLREGHLGVIDFGITTYVSTSMDRETSMGLVQHEGGPCGILAAIQNLQLHMKRRRIAIPNALKCHRKFDPVNKLGEGGFGPVYKVLISSALLLPPVRLKRKGELLECKRYWNSMATRRTNKLAYKT